jgi:glycosyltransferase involved in cell wall biosynthesis
MKLSIIVPCYNEAATLARVIERVESSALPPGWEKEIIVVDDGSTDETRDVMRNLAGEGRIRALFHAHNRGKGAAVKSGLVVAEGEYILIQDADMEYDPADYATLVNALKEGGSVFGSRNLGRNNVPYSAAYFYGGLLVTKLFNLLFGTRLSDIASCYKLFPRRFIPTLLRSGHDDFVFDAVDITLLLVSSGHIAEVPIAYAARSKQGGKKLNWVHGIEIVFALLFARLGVGLEHRSRATKLSRFLISGTIAAIVHVGTLYILAEYVGIWYLLASSGAFVVAFAVSFTMQKFWTFHDKDKAKVKRQLPQHFMVASVNFWLNIGLMYLFVEYAGVWYILAQLMSSSLIAVESFLLFRLIFR